MFLCKGFAASGRCMGPMYVTATDKRSAATEYAGVVWRLLGVLIKAVDVEGDRFTIGSSIEFYARPAIELDLALTHSL